MKTLGQRIRDLRDGKDLSLRELAKRLDVTAAFLSDIELGRRYPSEKVLAGIAHVLETSVEDLRSYDTRAPLDDIKRLVNSDPMYGVAFRKMIDRKMSPQEMITLAEQKNREKEEK